MPKKKTRGGTIAGFSDAGIRGFNKKLGRWIAMRRRKMKAAAVVELRQINGEMVEVTVFPPADVTGDMLGGRATARPRRGK